MTQLVPSRDKEVEFQQDGIFSGYTHRVLEDFIQEVIDQNEDALPTEFSRNLVREFFLYGFLKASGQEFRELDGRISQWLEDGEMIGTKMPRYEENSGKFYTNNGILALSDFDGEVYIRGGDSYHGAYVPKMKRRSFEVVMGYKDPYDEKADEIGGVEGTLLGLGYRQSIIFVPHSNGEVFADPNREKLFELLHYFSRTVRHLRGEAPRGLIVKDLSEPEPPAPYPRRDPSLPRIELRDTVLIPGNNERTIVYE